MYGYSENLVASHGTFNDQLRVWKRNFLLALKKAKESKTDVSSDSIPSPIYVPSKIGAPVEHKSMKHEELLKEVDALFRRFEWPEKLPSISWIRKVERLSIALQQSGFPAESIGLFRIWIPLMEMHYAQHKRTYASNMIISYYNFSCALSAQKEHVQALKIMHSAFDIRRNLNYADPASTRMHSSLLHGLAYCYIKLERYNEALPFVEKSIVILEKMPENKARIYKFTLARSYGHLAHCTVHLKSRKDSLEHFYKCLDLHRDLGAFTRFEKASLATALSTLSYHLLKLFEPFEALPVIEEAVGMYEELVLAEPRVYSSCLNASVRNLRICRILVMYLKVYYSLKSRFGLAAPVRDPEHNRVS